jgi:hypothetical protein
MMESLMTTVPVYRGHLEEPLWLEHPQLRGTVDVAALEVTAFAQESVRCQAAESLEGNGVVEASVSQDVFIIGFPLGLVAGNAPVPVWKRATIATEPSFEPDGRPIIYVDTASRKGMSASLALVRHNIVGEYERKDGTKALGLSARKDHILGIYSGRLGASDVEAQLGIVWKRSLIEAVVVAGVAPELSGKGQ